jgi:hypothetical protein
LSQANVVAPDRGARRDCRCRDWGHVRLAAIDRVELREIVIEAWRMAVPKRPAAAHLGLPADPESSISRPALGGAGFVP